MEPTRKRLDGLDIHKLLHHTLSFIFIRTVYLNQKIFIDSSLTHFLCFVLIRNIKKKNARKHLLIDLSHIYRVLWQSGTSCIVNDKYWQLCHTFLNYLAIRGKS